METFIALLSFACLVAAWAVLPVRKTHEPTTAVSMDRVTKTEAEEKAGQLVAASAR